MRHFYSVQHLLDGLREEAERQGCTIIERDGRVLAVAVIACECGSETLEDLDLTDIAQRLWGRLS